MVYPVNVMLFTVGVFDQLIISLTKPILFSLQVNYLQKAGVILTYFITLYSGYI